MYEAHIQHDNTSKDIAEYIDVHYNSISRVIKRIEREDENWFCKTSYKFIKVIEEWSYVDDPDIRPRIYKYMGISRTQWAITATINWNKYEHFPLSKNSATLNEKPVEPEDFLIK